MLFRSLDPEDQAAMADDLAAAKGEGTSAEIGERRLVARVGNMALAFGRWAYRVGNKVGVVIGGGVAGAVGAAMWFVDYQVSVHNFLVNVFGPSAAGWFDVAIKYVVALVT